MNGMDLLVVVVFFIIGYLVFSVAWDKFKGAKPDAAPAAPAAAPTGDAPWHEVLKLDPGAGAAEIDAAYLALRKQYEADRRTDLGEEFRALTEQRFAALERAYREALATRRS